MRGVEEALRSSRAVGASPTRENVSLLPRERERELARECFKEKLVCARFPIYFIFAGTPRRRPIDSSRRSCSSRSASRSTCCARLAALFVSSHRKRTFLSRKRRALFGERSGPGKSRVSRKAAPERRISRVSRSRFSRSAAPKECRLVEAFLFFDILKFTVGRFSNETKRRKKKNPLLFFPFPLSRHDAEVLDSPKNAGEEDAVFPRLASFPAAELKRVVGRARRSVRIFHVGETGIWTIRIDHSNESRGLRRVSRTLYDTSESAWKRIPEIIKNETHTVVLGLVLGSRSALVLEATIRANSAPQNGIHVEGRFPVGPALSDHCFSRSDAPFSGQVDRALWNTRSRRCSAKEFRSGVR